MHSSTFCHHYVFFALLSHDTHSTLASRDRPYFLLLTRHQKNTSFFAIDLASDQNKSYQWCKILSTYLKQGEFLNAMVEERTNKMCQNRRSHTHASTHPSKRSRSKNQNVVLPRGDTGNTHKRVKNSVILVAALPALIPIVDTLKCKR